MHIQRRRLLKTVSAAAGLATPRKEGKSYADTSMSWRLFK